MIDLIYLAPILLLGIFTSYSDILVGKIRNIHLIGALCLFFIMTIILSVFGYAEMSYIETLVNFVFAFVIGAVFWYFGLWTSADARLLAVYALLIPITVYKQGSLPYFPGAFIIINTFVPFFIFYFFRLLFFTSIRQKKDAFKGSFKPLRLLMLALSIFALEWFVKLLSALLSPLHPSISLLFQNFFFSIMLIALLLFIMTRAIGLNFAKIAIVIAALRLVFDRSIFSLDFLYYFGLILMLFIITRFLILQLAHSVYVTHCDIKLLRPGMMPAESVIKGKKFYKKISAIHFSLFSYLQPKEKHALFRTTGSGFTVEDIKILRNLQKQGKLHFDHLAIYQSLPFAPFLFLGTLITFIAGGSLILLFQTFI